MSVQRNDIKQGFTGRSTLHNFRLGCLSHDFEFRNKDNMFEMCRRIKLSVTFFMLECVRLKI